MILLQYIMLSIEHFLRFKSFYLPIYFITLVVAYGSSRKHYKCLESKFPSSNVAIFAKDRYGNLELKTMKKVKNVNNPSSFRPLFSWQSYNLGGSGDSGGPVSAKVNVPNKYPRTATSDEETRHVLLAIFTNSGNMFEQNEFPINYTKCLTTGTKVSEDIVRWIKKLESMELNSGE